MTQQFNLLNFAGDDRTTAPFSYNVSDSGLGHEPIKAHAAAISSCHDWFGNRPVFRLSLVKHFLQRAWSGLCFHLRRSWHWCSRPCCVIPTLLWRIPISLCFVSHDGCDTIDFSKKQGWGRGFHLHCWQVFSPFKRTSPFGKRKKAFGEFVHGHYSKTYH